MKQIELLPIFRARCQTFREMTLQIPAFEPAQITRGETVTWLKRLTSYPPGAGWTLTYYFRGAGAGVDVVATTSNSDYSHVMTAAQSAALVVGVYSWQAWVSKGSGVTLERYMVDSGTVVVKEGFTSVTTSTTFDGRCEACIQRDAIRAVLAGTASAQVLSYTIGNRQVTHYSRAELIALETRFTQLCNQQRRADNFRQGHPFIKSVHTRFTEPD